VLFFVGDAGSLATLTGSIVRTDLLAGPDSPAARRSLMKSRGAGRRAPPAPIVSPGLATSLNRRGKKNSGRRRPILAGDTERKDGLAENFAYRVACELARELVERSDFSIDGGQCAVASRPGGNVLAGEL